MSSTLAVGGLAFSKALGAALERRAEEDAADAERYAIAPGERRRVLGEVSPCSFLGRSLKVTRTFEPRRGQHEEHRLDLGKLRIEVDAFLGKLDWCLRYDMGGGHYEVVARMNWHTAARSSLADCMAQAEAALAAFKASVANAEAE